MCQVAERFVTVEAGEIAEVFVWMPVYHEVLGSVRYASGAAIGNTDGVTVVQSTAYPTISVLRVQSPAIAASISTFLTGVPFRLRSGGKRRASPGTEVMA